MKNSVIIFILFVFLTGCSKEKFPTVIRESLLSANLQGMYQENTNIIVKFEQFDNLGNVSGFSLVRGNKRPFSGTAEIDENNDLIINAKEPGDDSSDGIFKFEITNIVTNFKGEWTKDNKNVKVFELSNYPTGIPNPTKGQPLTFRNDGDQSELVLNTDNTCLVTYKDESNKEVRIKGSCFGLATGIYIEWWKPFYYGGKNTTLYYSEDGTELIYVYSEKEQKKYGEESAVAFAIE